MVVVRVATAAVTEAAALRNGGGAAVRAADAVTAVVAAESNAICVECAAAEVTNELSADWSVIPVDSPPLATLVTGALPCKFAWRPSAPVAVAAALAAPRSWIAVVSDAAARVLTVA